MAVFYAELQQRSSTMVHSRHNANNTDTQLPALYTAAVHSLLSTQLQHTVYSVYSYSTQSTLYTAAVHSLLCIQLQYTVYSLHSCSTQSTLYTAAAPSLLCIQLQYTV